MINFIKGRKSKKLLKQARELKANIDRMGSFRPADVNAADCDYYERLISESTGLLGFDNSENKIG